MQTHTVTAEFTFSWLNNNTWSEAYVGVRRLAYEVLPTSQGSATAEDGALCQLALIGANHLMEVGLYRVLLPYAKATSKVAALTEALLSDATYHHMLARWLPLISGKQIDLGAEPFASTERLRRRRNDTAHKSSALATVGMAKSALFSAVEGTRAVYKHAATPFPYEAFFAKYPLPPEVWFSQVAFPE